ncbi:hypothetical protein BofuT4_P135930.1 [Botrytis cinerea T4]|uniref:Uncharacterized protein n=1 Tax=Botryotinia fuckeliana (strain T4) TaxID=999810 RepID=G2YPK0_BOTF4|nr:hypothetical protein BofuT4_P135930.1 [Botrytis cinerea T4]
MQISQCMHCMNTFRGLFERLAHNEDLAPLCRRIRRSSCPRRGNMADRYASDYFQTMEAVHL